MRKSLAPLIELDLREQFSPEGDDEILPIFLLVAGELGLPLLPELEDLLLVLLVDQVTQVVREQAPAREGEALDQSDVAKTLPGTDSSHALGDDCEVLLEEVAWRDVG